MPEILKQQPGETEAEYLKRHRQEVARRASVVERLREWDQQDE